MTLSSQLRRNELLRRDADVGLAPGSWAPVGGGGSGRVSGQFEQRSAAILSGDAATETDAEADGDANGSQVAGSDDSAEQPRPTPPYRPTPRPRPRPGAESTATGPAKPPTGLASQPPRGAGTVIADRYRLLALAGADMSVHAEFWRARDTVLERDVALTL